MIGPQIELGADVIEADPADLEALRIEAGIPAHGAEITADTIPAELGRFVIESSVSFTKGCFTGQELVARIDSRGGNVPRPVRGLVIDGDEVPPVGAELLADDQTVGRITSSARSATLGPVALAPIKPRRRAGSRRRSALGFGQRISPGARPALDLTQCITRREVAKLGDCSVAVAESVPH